MIAENVLPNMDLGTWDDRAHDEIEFWRNWIHSAGGKWPEDFKRRTDPEAPLIEAVNGQLDEMGVDPSKPSEILDIGSGPLSLLGYNSPNRVIRLTLVDPLAEAYNQALDDAGIEGIPRPKTGYFETALGQLGENRFDLVWCRNSLDHSIDPLLGLYNLISMCRFGGCLILGFHPNEAETGKYQGLHQWNLDTRGEKIILSQKDLELDLTHLLSQQEVLSISHQGETSKDKGDITIKLRKVGDPNLSQAMMQALAT